MFCVKCTAHAFYSHTLLTPESSQSWAFDHNSFLFGMSHPSTRNSWELASFIQLVAKISLPDGVQEHSSSTRLASSHRMTPPTRARGWTNRQRLTDLERPTVASVQRRDDSLIKFYPSRRRRVWIAETWKQSDCWSAKITTKNTTAFICQQNYKTINLCGPNIKIHSVRLCRWNSACKILGVAHRAY